MTKLVSYLQFTEDFDVQAWHVSFWEFIGGTENKARCISSQHLRWDFFVRSFFSIKRKEKRDSFLPQDVILPDQEIAHFAFVYDIANQILALILLHLRGLAKT